MNKRKNLGLYLHGDKVGFFDNKLYLKAINLNRKKWSLSYEFIISVGILCVLMIFL